MYLSDYFTLYLYPCLRILWNTWVVEDKHIDEKYYTHYKTCFYLKLLLQNILQIKLYFMQKNHTTFHEDILGLRSRRCVEYSMYPWQYFCWQLEYLEDVEDYGEYDDAEEWGLEDNIDCLWLRWSHFAFIYPLWLCDCNKCHRNFTICLKLCNNYYFECSELIFISLCRQLDLGIDK
jgi:hypothetical protein